MSQLTIEEQQLNKIYSFIDHLPHGAYGLLIALMSTHPSRTKEVWSSVDGEGSGNRISRSEMEELTPMFEEVHVAIKRFVERFWMLPREVSSPVWANFLEAMGTPGNRNLLFKRIIFQLSHKSFRKLLDIPSIGWRKR